VEEIEKFNLIKHINEKDGRLEDNLFFDGENVEEDLIRITVKDTGVGIPKEIQTQLFSLYGTFDHHKGNSSKIAKLGLNTNGVGLGLVIAKKLVGLLGPCEYIEV
jgi:signal transduction histidine kinase